MVSCTCQAQMWGPATPNAEGSLYRKRFQKTSRLIFTGVGPEKWLFVGIFRLALINSICEASRQLILGNQFNCILNVFLNSKNHGDHPWIIALITLPEEQVMHLTKLDIPYSCTSIVAHLWASIAICKNSQKSKNLCMAWNNDCGLRTGTFLAFVQSNVMYYTLEHFSKLCKKYIFNSYPSCQKQPNRLVRLLRTAVLHWIHCHFTTLK